MASKARCSLRRSWVLTRRLEATKQGCQSEGGLPWTPCKGLSYEIFGLVFQRASMMRIC